MEYKACPIPYIPPRIFLFPLVKKTGKDWDGKGTALAGRAQTAFCCSLNHNILLECFFALPLVQQAQPSIAVPTTHPQDQSR